LRPRHCILPSYLPILDVSVMTSPTTRNIIIFGSSGSGKSSVVNLLAAEPVADTSGGAKGCTFENKAYPITVDGAAFKIYDTTGLDEGSAGKIPATEALRKLYDLIMQLSMDGGLSLLIFCLRAGRLSETSGANWQLFNRIVCQQKVPTCIAVTGLENADRMEDWGRSTENRAMLEAYGMVPFCGIAGITAIQGKMKKGHYQFQDEYDESRTVLQKMITDHFLRTSWNPQRAQWYKQVVETTIESDCWSSWVRETTVTVPGAALEQLRQLRGYSEKMVAELASSFAA